METPAQIQNYIRNNDIRLRTLYDQLSFPQSESNGLRIQNEIDFLHQAQRYWWGRLAKARSDAQYEYQFEDQHITGGGNRPNGGSPVRQPIPSTPPPGTSPPGSSSGSTSPRGIPSPEPGPIPTISVNGDRCAEFQFVAPGFYVDGKMCVTGSVDIKPKNAPQAGHVTFNQEDAKSTGKIAFDSALASATGSLQYDSATNLFDASIDTELKVGDGSLTFSSPVVITRAVQPQFVKVSWASMPQKVKGSTSQFDFEGQIGLTIEATIVPRFPLHPIPIPHTVPLPRPTDMPRAPRW